eukprot:6183583-Pleurochrysis_carterae.AAC.3
MERTAAPMRLKLLVYPGTGTEGHRDTREPATAANKGALGPGKQMEMCTRHDKLCGPDGVSYTTKGLPSHKAIYGKE